MAGVPPKRAESYTFYVALTSQADTNIFQVNPTLAAGDVRVSLDGGAFNNLAALPSAQPAAGKQVRVSLSVAEMTPAVGGVVGVLFSDQAGAEWQDLYIEIHPVGTPIDDLTAAIWTYATRTLTSFGTLVADVAQAVWLYASRTLTSYMASIPRVFRGEDISIYRGDTLVINITKLGDISARTNLWFTIKDSKADADSASIIQIDESSGLLYIDGSAASVAANGSIAVTDAALGNLTITLAAVEAAKLDAESQLYGDIQMVTAAGVVTTLARYDCCITEDVTRATS